MSRTYGHGTGYKWNGRKYPGYEYWSKRPGPLTPGKQAKIITHGIERMQKKELLLSVLKGNKYEY